MMQSNIIQLITNRVHKLNKNFLAVVCGETGSGKSYAALRLAEVLDNGFSAERCVFTKSEFFKLLASGKLKRGSVVIFDEAGVGLGARQWYSHQEINAILQTFRHRNYIVFFTVPSLDFVDKQARQLFHAYFQMNGIDFNHSQSVVRVLHMQNNPQYGKVYYRTTRKRVNGEVTKQRIFRISLPSKRLLDEYEYKKGRFTGKIVIDAKEAIKKKTFYFDTIKEIDKMLSEKKIKNVKELEKVWRRKTGTSIRRYYQLLKEYQKKKRKY